MGLGLDKCCGANNTINIINNADFVNVNYVNGKNPS